MKQLVVIVSILLVPGIVRAQDKPAPHNGQRQVVFFREAGSNRDIRAELVKLDSSSVVLQVGKTRRELPLTLVSRIQVPVTDSIKNGTLIGAAIAGIWCAVICGQGLDSKDQILPALAVNAGVGALLGAVIDASNYDLTTIYPSGASSQHRLTLGPGFTLRLRF